MRILDLLDKENRPLPTINKIARKQDLRDQKIELTMIIVRSNWMKSWIQWSGSLSIFDLPEKSARSFLESVSHGSVNTFKLISSKMNSLHRYCIRYHPSKDSSDSPDIKPWNQLKRQIFTPGSIFEPNKILTAMEEVSKDAEFVRNGTGFLSIFGYGAVAGNLNNADMRLLVGSSDTRGRMQIATVVSDLEKSIESGPASLEKDRFVKSMRSSILGGGLESQMPEGQACARFPFQSSNLRW